MTRDAAYSQMPRGVRAEKHAAAARWLEGRMSDGLGDSTEAVAHHYVAAVGLLAEMRDEAGAAALRPAAAAALARAGDHASRLDAEMAARDYAHSLELMHAPSTERIIVQTKLAPLLFDEGRAAEAQTMLKQAVEAAREADDSLHAAVALSQLARILLRRAEPQAFDLAAEAAGLLETGSASPEGIAVLEQLAMLRIQAADTDAVTRLTARIAEMCAVLDAPMPHMAQGLRGYARFGAGHLHEGVQDLLDAVREAEVHGTTSDVGRLLDAAAALITMEQGAAASADLRREGIEAARRRNDAGSVFPLAVGLVENLIVLGEWSEALALGEDLEREHERGGFLTLQSDLEALLAFLNALRGELEATRRHIAWLQERQAPAVGLESIGLIARALYQASTGADDESASTLSRLRGPGNRFFSDPAAMLWWPEAVRTAASAGRKDIAIRLVDDALDWSWCLREVRETLTALRAETGGDLEAAVRHYAQAAAGWEEWVFPYEQGQSCLRLGHCLVTLGRAKDAAGPLRKAWEIFVRLHAGPALSTTRDLIERAGGQR